MKSADRPVRTTIIFGLLAAFVFLPVAWATAGRLLPASAPRVALSLMVAVYIVLLSRWAGARLASAAFPVLLLLILALCSIPAYIFFLVTLGVLSWVRSGVCFHQRIIRAFVVEAALGVCSAILMLNVGQGTPIIWTLAVWTFFLVQSLYFILCGFSNETEVGTEPADPFEQACLRAERILTDPPA